MMQLLDQVEDLLEEQEYADAWTRLEAASELPLSADEQAQALFWRSNWYSYQGRYADAEPPIREAIDTVIDPQWLCICNRHLASLLVSLARYKEALELCDSALESIDPTCEEYPDFEYWRASAYYGQGRMVEAAQAYRDCIASWGELSGESFGVYVSLVDIAARDGDWSTAWAHVRKAQAIYRLCSDSADDRAAAWADQLDGWKELVDGWVGYLTRVAPCSQPRQRGQSSPMRKAWWLILTLAGLWGMLAALIMIPALQPIVSRNQSIAKGVTYLFCFVTFLVIDMLLQAYRR